MKKGGKHWVGKVEKNKQNYRTKKEEIKRRRISPTRKREEKILKERKARRGKFS